MAKTSAARKKMRESALEAEGVQESKEARQDRFDVLKRQWESLGSRGTALRNEIKSLDLLVRVIQDTKEEERLAVLVEDFDGKADAMTKKIIAGRDELLAAAKENPQAKAIAESAGLAGTYEPNHIMNAADVDEAAEAEAEAKARKVKKQAKRRAAVDNIVIEELPKPEPKVKAADIYPALWNRYTPTVTNRLLSAPTVSRLAFENKAGEAYEVSSVDTDGQFSVLVENPKGEEISYQIPLNATPDQIDTAIGNIESGKLIVLSEAMKKPEAPVAPEPTRIGRVIGKIGRKKLVGSVAETVVASAGGAGTERRSAQPGTSHEAGGTGGASGPTGPETRQPVELAPEKSIIDIPERELLAVIGHERFQQVIQDLIEPETKARALLEWKEIFSHLTPAERQQLEQCLAPHGYRFVEFLKLWDSTLSTATFGALEQWAAQETRNAAAASVSFTDRVKIGWWDRTKQALPLVGIASATVATGVGGSMLKLAKPVVGAAVGGVAGGMGGFWRDKIGSIFKKSQDSIAKKTADLEKERLTSGEVLRTVGHQFMAAGSRDAASFLSETIRQASPQGRTDLGVDRANAHLLYRAFLKKNVAEAGAAVGEQKDEAAVIERQQDDRAKLLIAELYAGRTAQTIEAMLAKDPQWVNVVKKLLAVKSGRFDELFATYERQAADATKSAAEKKILKERWQKTLAGALAGASMGTAFAYSPELRAAVAAIAGGYLGYKYGEGRNRAEQEKAFVKEINAQIAEAEGIFVQHERSAGSPGENRSIEQLRTLATDLRTPISLGLLSPDKNIGLYVRANNVLRRVESVIFEEQLRDERAEGLLTELTKHQDVLIADRKDVLARLNKRMYGRALGYGILGAIGGATIAYGGGDAIKFYGKELGLITDAPVVPRAPAPHEASPVRMPVAEAPPAPAQEVHLVGAAGPDGKGGGLSYALDADVRGHHDHLREYIQAHPSRETAAIERILARHGGDMDKLTPKEFAKIDGLIATQKDWMGLGVSKADQVGVQWNETTKDWDVVTRGADGKWHAPTIGDKPGAGDLYNMRAGKGAAHHDAPSTGNSADTHTVSAAIEPTTAEQEIVPVVTSPRYLYTNDGQYLENVNSDNGPAYFVPESQIQAHQPMQDAYDSTGKFIGEYNTTSKQLLPLRPGDMAKHPSFEIVEGSRVLDTTKIHIDTGSWGDMKNAIELVYTDQYDKTAVNNIAYLLEQRSQMYGSLSSTDDMFSYINRLGSDSDAFTDVYLPESDSGYYQNLMSEQLQSHRMSIDILKDGILHHSSPEDIVAELRAKHVLGFESFPGHSEGMLTNFLLQDEPLSDSPDLLANLQTRTAEVWAQKIGEWNADEGDIEPEPPRM